MAANSLPTVLLTYELGSGQGHINRLIAVARRLAAGNKLVFALPNLAIGTDLVAHALGGTAEVMPGVVWPPPSGAGVRSVVTDSLADVMALFGFGDPARIRAKVEHWHRILREVRPDLIVADFAPTLRIALRSAVPVVVVGNGYTIPPAGQPLPPMRPWQNALAPESVDAERRILQAVNTVRAAIGMADFDAVGDLFSGDQTFVCTASIFDPYAAYRTAPTNPPFNIPVIEAGPVANQRTGPGIFVYMPASHPLFDMLIAVLNEIELPTQIYVTEGDPRAIAQRCRPHVGLLTRPADFARVLPQTRVLVHHAGLGTAYAGIAAGTPQFVLPVNLEQLITARGLVDGGVAQGISANAKADRAELKRGLLALVHDPAWTARARAAATRLAAVRSADPLEPIIAAANAFLCA